MSRWESHAVKYLRSEHCWFCKTCVWTYVNIACHFTSSYLWHHVTPCQLLGCYISVHCRKFGKDILDASGHIKLRLRSGMRQYTWKEVCARAPSYFITLSEGQALKNFQKSVFQTLTNVSAGGKDNSDSLQKLAKNVCELTMPTLQLYT